MDGARGLALIEGRDVAYALDARLVRRLLAGREAWRDRTLWSLEPGSIRELEWLGADGRRRFVRDGRTGQWVDPSGAPVDARRVAAAASFLARPRAEQFVELPAFLFIFVWFGIQLFNGYASLAVADGAGGVAWFAHIGGFVAGVVLIKLMVPRRPEGGHGHSSRRGFPDRGEVDVRPRFDQPGAH